MQTMHAVCADYLALTVFAVELADAMCPTNGS